MGRCRGRAAQRLGCRDRVRRAPHELVLTHQRRGVCDEKKKPTWCLFSLSLFAVRVEERVVIVLIGDRRGPHVPG